MMQRSVKNAVSKYNVIVIVLIMIEKGKGNAKKFECERCSSSKLFLVVAHTD